MTTTASRITLKSTGHKGEYLSETGKMFWSIGDFVVTDEESWCESIPLNEIVVDKEVDISICLRTGSSAAYFLSAEEGYLPISLRR
jgi:hypothetical protein